jgi:ABC-type nickel/cobalt efflux system permease component RcnA
MLAAVAGTIIYLGAALNEQIAGWLEFVVGVMLVALGGNVLWRLIRERIHFHAHKHDDGTLHLHAHSHAGETIPHSENAHAHEHPEGLPWRTLFVGFMHGLAGSAALLVLAATSINDPSHNILYVVVFGVGSIVGMAALSAVIAVPLGYTAKSLTWAHNSLRGGIGVFTTALGFVVMYETQLAHLWAGF